MREVRRVGKVGDDEVEDVAVVLQPGEGVGVDDMHLRREKRAVVKRGEQFLRGKKPRHRRIEIDERDALDCG